MKKEFNLSEKIMRNIYPDLLRKEDIKEFIKRLKDIIANGNKITGGILDGQATLNLIDKLAGEDLI